MTLKGHAQAVLGFFSFCLIIAIGVLVVFYFMVAVDGLLLDWIPIP